MQSMNANPIVYAEAAPQQPQVVAEITGYAPPPGTQSIGQSTVVAATSVTSDELKTSINEGGAGELLTEHKFPQGLQNTFIENMSRVPIRFFILDDSGSMMIEDGSMIHDSNGAKSMIKCTRWAELTNAMKFHLKIARAAEAPSEFRFLNGAHPLRVGFGDAGEADRVVALSALLDGSPGGGTPLCQHIREVVDEVRKVEHQLRAVGKKACIVIATDGQPSDGDIASVMRPLKDLPVMVVLRLCTNEDAVVEYWNHIDKDLELNMDVVDDLAGEAKEVRSCNPWLTYGIPLQRLREFGNTVKELDLVDEKKLSKDQVRRICHIIYGGKLDDYPHPEADMSAFVAKITEKNNQAPKTWDTQSKAERSWVDVNVLRSQYGGGSCCVIS